MRDVLERLAALEDDVALLLHRVKRLQGLVTGGLRRSKDAQEAPDGPNGDEPIPQQPPPYPAPRQVPSTAWLARRFKLGG